MVFQGPVRRGTSSSVFRSTGITGGVTDSSVRSGVFRGRRRGGSSSSSSGGGSSGAREAAERAAKEKAKRLAAEKKAREEAERERLRLELEKKRQRLRLLRESTPRGVVSAAEEQDFLQRARARLRNKRFKLSGKKGVVTDVTKAGLFLSSSLISGVQKIKDTKRKPPVVKKFENLSKAEQKRVLAIASGKKTTFQKISKAELNFIDRFIVKPKLKLLKKANVPVPKFLTKKVDGGNIFVDQLLLPAFSGSQARQGQVKIRQAAIKEGTRNPNIKFKSVIQPDGTTGTVAISKAADKNILTFLKTKPTGSKTSLGKGISVIKVKRGFKFINTNVGSVSTTLKGRAARVRTIPVKRNIKLGRRARAEVRGKLKLRQELDDAVLFASINLDKELAKQEIGIQQRKLTVLKRAKFAKGRTELKPKPTKKTALLGTVQRKGKNLLIKAGRAEFRKGNVRKGRFKPTIKGTARLIDKPTKNKIVIQAGNSLRREKLVQLKKSLQMAGVSIPQNLQGTVKQVTDKVFKQELVKLRTVVKKAPAIRTVVSSPSTKQLTKTRTIQVPSTKPTQRGRQGLRVGQLSRNVGRIRQKGRTVLKQPQPTAERIKQRQRTALKVKTKQKLRTKQRTRTPPFVFPRTPAPRNIPLPFFAFLLRNRLVKKRKKRIGGKDAFVLVEGFTAKALKLKPVKIKQSDIKKFVKRFQTIGTRRRPVIIRTPKRRVKKKKR